METIKTSLTHVISPLDSKEKGPHPALILLHGRGADEHDLLGLASYLDPRLLIFSARAPFRFPSGGYTWYDILEIGSPHPEQFKESYDRLMQFFDDIRKHYPIDTKRVFLLGFSMGTVMSYALSLTHPDQVKGVVAHSGYVPEDTFLSFKTDELEATSFFIAHGVYDPVIPITFGRRAKELLTKTAANLTYREYPIQHQIGDESLHDLASWLHQQITDSPAV